MQKMASGKPQKEKAFSLYNFSTNYVSESNISNLYPDLSPPVISHSVKSKLEELMNKSGLDKLVASEKDEHIYPYHHLVSSCENISSICKIQLSFFFFELVELMKINYMINTLENQSKSILFVNADSFTECTNFVSLYRNNVLNVFSTNIHDEIPPVRTNNEMDLIFMNNISRLEYYAALNIIITHQSVGGSVFIKTSDLFYKQSVEFLSILNSIYNQVLFVQPSISNALFGELFIICKNKMEISKMEISVCKSANNILPVHWPIHLLNKMEDMNLFFAKKQLEALLQYNAENYDSIFTSFMVKSNISKCLNWCKGFQLPLK